MPMGSEQNDPTNLQDWEPWLQATLGWGEGGVLSLPQALLLIAAWSNRKLAGHRAVFTASCYMEVSGVVAILGIPTEDGKANPTPA